MPRKSTTGAVDSPPSRLRIGAVSRLTRIPVDTLRVWERRYGVVAPSRELSAARLYDQDDVERLTRIKRLVDSGYAIGSVANLSRAELEGMLALHESTAQTRAGDEHDATEVVSYSDALSTPDSASATIDGFAVLGRYRSWSAFEIAVLDRAPAALVIEMAALLPERVDEILRLYWRSAAVRVVVCYGFSPAAQVRRLEAEGVIALQSPVGGSQILRELRRLATPTPGDEAATPPIAESRMFDDAALVEIAGLTTSVGCECPHHLVGIIRTLNDFEFYSASCEHHNANDAAVHAMLRTRTAQARASMERALVDVAQLEGLQLPAGIGGLPHS